MIVIFLLMLILILFVVNGLGGRDYGPRGFPSIGCLVLVLMFCFSFYVNPTWLIDLPGGMWDNMTAQWRRTPWLPLIGVVLFGGMLLALADYFKSRKKARDKGNQHSIAKDVIDIGYFLAVLLLILFLAGAIIWYISGLRPEIPHHPATKEEAKTKDKVITAPPKNLVQHPAQPTEQVEELLPMPLVVDLAAIKKAEADERDTVALNEKNEKAALVQFKIAESFLTDAEKARFKGDLQASDRLTNSARQWFGDVITAYPNTVAATEAKKRLNSK